MLTTNAGLVPEPSKTGGLQPSLETKLINPAVLIELDGQIGWIVLNRPDQLNAINDDIRSGIPQALDCLEADKNIRVIVFRGAGQRGFCSGADIKETRPPESAFEVRQRLEKKRWIEALDQVGKPIIVAIQGYCMGGGMELALACDIRYAAPDVIFSMPETGLGLIPGGGGTQRLGRVVGPGHALDLLLTGDRIGALEAKNIGLVTRVAVSCTSLLLEVRELALKIAAKSPAATLYVKRAAREALELDLKVGIDLELNLFSLLAPMTDVKEAALAFKEKRRPNFTGH